MNIHKNKFLNYFFIVTVILIIVGFSISKHDETSLEILQKNSTASDLLLQPKQIEESKRSNSEAINKNSASISENDKTLIQPISTISSEELTPVSNSDNGAENCWNRIQNSFGHQLLSNCIVFSRERSKPLCCKNSDRCWFIDRGRHSKQNHATCHGMCLQDVTLVKCEWNLPKMEFAMLTK